MDNKAAQDGAERSTAILNWMGSSDTGISSKVLALASVGITGHYGDTAPGDSNDSGRCERLARTCPFVVEALPGLVERNPRWAKWADAIRGAAA